MLQRPPLQPIEIMKVSAVDFAIIIFILIMYSFPLNINLRDLDRCRSCPSLRIFFLAFCMRSYEKSLVAMLFNLLSQHFLLL